MREIQDQRLKHAKGLTKVCPLDPVPDSNNTRQQLPSTASFMTGENDRKGYKVEEVALGYVWKLAPSSLLIDPHLE